MSPRKNCKIVLSLGLALAGWSRAQQRPPQPAPVKRVPIGVPVPPLGDGPFVLDTAEQHKIRVTVITKGLSHPWSLVFLPDGNMLVSERPGRLRIIRNGVLDPAPIAGVPTVYTRGLSGLMDVALHPKFGENKLIYFTYTKEMPGKMVATALGRAKLDGSALTELTDVRELLASEPWDGTGGSGSRIAFGRDGMLYMSIGASNNNLAQEPGAINGKVLRLKDDGTPAPGNPFLGRPGYKPEILHHRPPQCARADPASGHGRYMGERERPQWRRRNQHSQARQELRVAHRQLWARLRRPSHFGQSLARRLGASDRILGPVHRGLRHGRLYRRPFSRLEEQCVRRRDAHGGDPRHGSSGTHRLERQDGRAAARVHAGGTASTHPRSAAGSRRIAVPLDRRRPRRTPSH